MNFHPDIVLMIFRLEKPTAQITKAAVEAFDADLDAANHDAIVAACAAAGLSNPSKYDRSRVLGLAALALGSVGKLTSAARAYKKAVDEGIVG
jgi:hypothetical protein